MYSLKTAPSIISLYFIVQFNGILSKSTSTSALLKQRTMTGKFLYFAYGSNLLMQRIHINNPSAIRAGIGKLQDFELDFITYSNRWQGAAATIVNKKGSHVWGALWEIDNEHLVSLDRQEGVHDNIYTGFNVDVELPSGKTLTARVYQQTNTPDQVDNIENIPDERKPSAVYLNTILKGAEESGLPEEYQRWLKRIPHNGYNGNVDVGLDLNVFRKNN